jgi:hypothetical protein
VVQVKGRVGSGTVATTIFTLPTAYWPAEHQLFAVRSNGSFGSIHVIGTTGDVKQADGTNVDLSLSLTFAAKDRRPDITKTAAGGYPVQWLSSVRGVVQNVVCWQAAELVAGAEVRSMLPCVWDTAIASDGRTQINVRTVPGLNPLTAYNLVFAVFGR